MGKMTRMILLCCLKVFILLSPLMGQVNKLTERDFIHMLRNYHPQVISAELEMEVGRQEIVAAKGAFDPILAGTVNRKLLQGTDYYTKYDIGIRQPISVLGIDIEGGFELNRGTYLNPERNTPVSGLGYLGIRLPLLQGLSIDRRRTDLRLSKLYSEQTQIKNRDVLNKVYLDGLGTYWNWIRARQRVEVLEEVLENNQVVFEGIKVSHLQGDLPAIDTVEAFQQLQRIKLQYNTELIQLQRSYNQFKTYLYGTDVKPFEIAMDAPASGFDEAKILQQEIFQMLVQDSFFDNHPNISFLKNESERLSTLLRWERERLKPRLDLQYNFLADTGLSPLEQTFLNDNYQAGLSLQFPILFRNARAKTEQIKIYSRQNSLNLIDEYNILRNAADATRFRLENTRMQADIALSMNSDAKRLYDAELTRFRLGESSVFLVNTRELQYLQAQNALIDLRMEVILQGYRLLYDLGVLYEIAE